MRGVFVTGTDTGVGKTLVGCALAAAMRERGLRVGVHKPVETGCKTRHGRPTGEDVESLRAAAGGVQSYESVTSHLFELPAAPLVAARAAKVELHPAALVAGASAAIAAHDFTIVEGAGGLLVPLAERYTFLDFARDLGEPVLVVVGSKLGCINHALLTLDALEAAGLPRAGFVMNDLGASDDPGVGANLAMIQDLSTAGCLGTFPNVPSPSRSDYRHLAALAAEHLDLDVFGR